MVLRDAESMAMDDERWQVSGSAARKYEQFVASWFVSWAVDLVQRAEVEPGWSVLDLACGTGVVARALGPVLGPAGDIVASDLNDAMLDEARQHPVWGASVQWRQADATDLPFGTEVFDAVLCQQGLQFVPDRARAVAEIGRVLRPGGVAAVSVWASPENNPYISALADGLSQHVSPEAGQTMLAPCALGDPEVLAALFDGAGFASVEVQTVTLEREPADPVEAIGGNLAALPIADQIGAMDTAKYDKMIEHIAAALANHITDGQLTAPNCAHIAVAVA